MYTIEVQSKNQRWVAAVYPELEKGEAYLESLKKSGLEVHVITIPINDFPIYVIERKDKEGNYFEYLDDDGYIQLVREQKENRYHKDDFEAYFTVYYFDSTYFQQPHEHSLMTALEYRKVDNYFLMNDSLDKGFGIDHITRLVNNLEIDKLDELFDQYMESGTTHEKTKLAEGYQLLFDDMDYDFACGKLTAYGITLLIHVVEKACLLLEEPLWEYYSKAYMILLEDAIENNPEKVDGYFQKALETTEQFRTAFPEYRQECFRKMALVLEMMTSYQHFDEKHWRKAISNIKQSVETGPLKGDWGFYLKLLYIPYELRKGNKVGSESTVSVEERYHRWRELRIGEIEGYASLAKKAIKNNQEVALSIAMAFKKLREDFKWYKADMDLFPREENLFWINQARQCPIPKTTHFELLEAAFYFQSEGKELEDIGLLEKAVELFDRMINGLDDPAFEVYHKAETLEEISDIHRKHGRYELADEYREKVTQHYEDNIALVRSNPSVFMHYAEYLERCYFYPGNVTKPPLEKIKSLAIETEEEGEGMYSQPTMLRVRIAIHEKEEEEVIFLLTRLLILHELGVENQFLEVRRHFDPSTFSRLDTFIKDTICFMNEVRENYYLDPQLRWDELKKMGRKEVAASWKKRKEEIRNRKGFQ